MSKKDAIPAHLSAEAKRLWGRLLADYALDDAAGRLLLQSALEAFDRLQDARRAIKAQGAITLDRWGQAKPHPACGIERDARAQMHAALRLMKLAPGEIE